MEYILVFFESFIMQTNASRHTLTSLLSSVSMRHKFSSQIVATKFNPSSMASCESVACNACVVTRVIFCSHTGLFVINTVLHEKL